MHAHGEILFYTVVAAFGLLSIPTYLGLDRRAAGYGRHAPIDVAGLPSQLAWILMELPSAITFAAVGWSSRTISPQGWLLLALWEAHYLQRGILYPLRIRSTRKVPYAIVCSAMAFTSLNGALNAWALYRVRPELGAVGLFHPRLLVGVVLFLAGMGLNLDSDARLRHTPRGPAGAYGVPTGGLYRFVSSPNYLGEIIEWLGWTMAAGTGAALVFWLWTLANLVPRARANHAWCLRHIAGYPRSRRPPLPLGALIVIAISLSGARAHADPCPAGYTRFDASGPALGCARAVAGSSYREHLVRVRVDAAPERVIERLWQRIEGGVLEGLQRREFLRREPRWLVFYDQIHAPVVSDRDYTVEVVREDAAAHHEIRFALRNDLGPPPAPHHVRIPAMRAQWVAEPDNDGGTSLSYLTYSEPGGSVAAFLVRGAQARRAMSDVTSLLAALRTGSTR